MPVTLPPGLFRLATKPGFIGSLPKVAMIGIVLVAAMAAKWAPPAPISNAGWRRTRSEASSGNRSTCPSAHRYSTVTFWFSTNPFSLKPVWNNKFAPSHRPSQSEECIVAGQTGRLEVVRLAQGDVRFGSKADIARHQLNVRFPPEADIAERDWHVRFVPKADSCTAAREILFDSSSARCRKDSG